MMVRARELRDAGWSIGRIRRLLAAEFGCSPPSPNTIWCWVEPAAGERQAATKRESQRDERAASASFVFPGKRSPQWKLGRMRALRRAGMSVAAICTVMWADFGDELTINEGRRAIETGQLPRQWREVAATRRTA
jgi:hypothetical protein